MSTISALAGLHQAEALVTAVAAAIAPGSPVKDDGTMVGPDTCSAPQHGKVYYTIFKTVDAPNQADGATLQQALIAELTRRGFTLAAPTVTGGWPTVFGGTTYVGIRVLLSPDTPELRFTVDSQCGTPEPGDPTGV